MKIIKRFWREALLLLSLGSFAYLMYRFAVDRPASSMGQSLMMVGIILSAAVSVLLLRSLWRAKWKTAATEQLQRLFVKLQGFFDRFATKLGISRKSKTILGGKTTVFFDKYDRFGLDDEEKIQKKPPKWKHLTDDRGRMRYLYRQMVAGKIKRGACICASDTPGEVKTAESKGGQEDALFDLYIAFRYDERRVPNGETVKALKEELEIK